MKKLISITLSLLMVLSIIPAFAFSASALDENTVAVIGETEYATLFGEQGALANAKDGDTIVMVKDSYGESGPVTLDKAVTLDLAGKNIVNSADSVVFTASAKLTIRSTVDGKGEANTAVCPVFGYSGTLIRTSSEFEANNVEFIESKSFTVINESDNILASGGEWISGHYGQDGAHQQYSGRICLENKIDVTPGSSLKMDIRSSVSGNHKFVIRGYDSEGKFIKTLTTDAKGTLAIPSNCTTIAVSLYDSGNSTSTDQFFTHVKDGKVKPIIFNNYAYEATSSLSGKSSFFVPTADGSKLTMKNSVFDEITTGATPNHWNFSSYGTEFDVENSSIKFGSNNNNYGINFNNAGISGTFKNTDITMKQGIPVIVNKTAEAGLTFTGCNISESAYDQGGVFSVNNGNVVINGGTVISGKECAGRVLNANGGSLLIDDATISGDKGDGTTKMPMNISANCNLKILKAHIKRGTKNNSVLVNNSDLLWAALETGYGMYNSNVHNEDTALMKSANVAKEVEVYITTCEHNLRELDATCTEGGICRCCGSEIPALGHTETYESTASYHKQVCQRCDFVGEEEAHSGGTATCVAQAPCEKCGHPYGELGDHTFTKYVRVDVEYFCPHYMAEVADCDNGCGAANFRCQLKKNPECDDQNSKDYYIRDVEAENELKITKEAVNATCTEEGTTVEKVCPECGKVIIPSSILPAKGHVFGDTVIETAPDYFNEGEGYHECVVCNFKEDVVVPKLSFKSTVVAIIGDKYDSSAKQFTSIFGPDGAYAAAEPGQTIMVVRDFKERSTENITVDKDLVIDLVGHKFETQLEKGIDATANITFKNTKTGLEGSENNETRAQITYSSTLIRGSKTTTFDNIELVAGANATVYSSNTPSSAEEPAKLVINDCSFTVSNKGSNMSALFFTNDNAVVIDVKNTNFQSGSGGNGINIASNVTGVFENCNFYKQSGLSVTIGKTGVEGVEFKNCYIRQSAWDATTFQMSGGKATLSEGTTIDGANTVTTVANLTGGTLILNDATIKGDKGDNANKKVLNISGSMDIVYKKAAIIRGTANGAKGSIYNSSTAFWNTLKGDGCAVYSQPNTTSGEYAFEADKDVVSEKAIYINTCNHDENTTTCTEDGYCKHCGTNFTAYGHDFSGYAFDETGHWHACSICGALESENPDNIVKEAHTGGQATCTSPAVCEICGASYGEPLGHDFTNNVIGHDETNHWIQCEREDCNAKKEGSIEAHKGEATECGKKPVCSTCHAEYGEAEEHVFINYVYNNDASCTTNGTETAVCANGCGATDTRTIANSALGHNWVVEKEVAPTCTTEGKTAGSHCSRCNLVREVPEVIPKSANAHKWDQGKITVAGDCCTERVLTYTCLLCHKTSSHKLGKVPTTHVYSNTYTVEKKATYFETGLKARYCVKCKKAKTSVTTIPKLKLKKPKVKYKISKKKLTVKYTKVTGATGFEIKYKVGKKWKTVKVNTKKSKSKVLTLKKGTYHVRIRAFVKSGSKTAYSSYTKLTKKRIK